jgi:Ca2+-binding EF-hand superfamily protein
MTRYVWLSIVGGAVAFTQVGYTAEPEKTTAVKFESLDKNGDGKVSINEATEHDKLFVAFKGLDKDKDGNLSKEEFAGYQGS